MGELENTQIMKRMRSWPIELRVIVIVSLLGGGGGLTTGFFVIPKQVESNTEGIAAISESAKALQEKLEAVIVNNDERDKERAALQRAEREMLVRIEERVAAQDRRIGELLELVKDLGRSHGGTNRFQ